MDRDKGRWSTKPEPEIEGVEVRRGVEGRLLQQFVSWKVSTQYYLRSHQQPGGVE